ncbi:MAG: bacteriocin-protection protein, partial [Betaproteobacteria bacterium]
MGLHKTSSGKPSITLREAQDEAICFGWIDGVAHSLDESSYTIRLTPRRRGS